MSGVPAKRVVAKSNRFTIRKYPCRCAIRYCTGIVRKSDKSDKCAKCRDRAFKEKHPLKWQFNSLRKHAKARGKDFTLTFKQFEAFAKRTDYMRLKGKSSLSLSIDRIDNSRGYHADNIQAITIRENCRKRFVDYFRNLTPEDIAKQEAVNRAALAEVER